MEQTNNNNAKVHEGKSKDIKTHPFLTNSPIDVDKFVEKTTELLNIEKDAEIDESILQQVKIQISYDHLNN